MHKKFTIGYILLGIGGILLVGAGTVLIANYVHQRYFATPQVSSTPTNLQDIRAALLSEPAASATLLIPAAEPQPVVVYVSGAVTTPDLYQLPPEARVADAVYAAGGLLPDADSERVNLAEGVHDEMHIHIPAVGEAVPDTGAAPTTGDTSTAPLPTSPININTAPVADLLALPGVGPTKAQNLVDYRTANGPFLLVDDLQEVPGFGPVLVDNLRPYVTVDES